MKMLVITGAGKGIGLCTADLFHEHGFEVINISRRRGGFEHGTWIAADLSEPGWLEKINLQLIGAVQHASQVAIVHNAAVLIRDSAEKNHDAEVQKVLQANVLAPMQLNRLLLPYMDEGSSIIYVGSALAERGAPKRLSYVASRHAQVGLMRATALEIAERGMHTACVCPAVTDTELARGHFGDDNAIEQFVLRDDMLKRALKPEEIARLIYFCAGAPAVNGTVIGANHGRPD